MRARVRETLVWCKGMEKWQKAKAVDDFQQLLPQKEKVEVIEPSPVPQPQKPKHVPQTERPLASISSAPKKGRNGIMIGLIVTVVVLVGLVAVLLATREDSDTSSSVPKRIDATASYSDNQGTATQDASTAATAQTAVGDDSQYDEFQPDGYDLDRKSVV